MNLMRRLMMKKMQNVLGPELVLGMEYLNSFAAFQQVIATVPDDDPIKKRIMQGDLFDQILLTVAFHLNRRIEKDRLEDVDWTEVLPLLKSHGTLGVLFEPLDEETGPIPSRESPAERMAFFEELVMSCAAKADISALTPASLLGPTLVHSDEDPPKRRALFSAGTTRR